MFDFFLETIKIGGGIAGLLSAAFLIRGRYIKHFPLAILVTRPLSPGSVNIEPFLFVKNVSDRPILITWQNHNRQNQLRVARDQSVHGAVESATRRETVMALGPETGGFLPVTRPSNFDDMNPDNTLEIDLRWRFAQHRILKGDRKIAVRISKRDLDYMVKHYTPPTDESSTG